MSKDIVLPSGTIVPGQFVPGVEKPEEAYELFSRLGAALGMPCPQQHLTLDSIGPDGETVSYYNERSRTLNRNYWNSLFNGFAILRGTTTGATSDTTFGAGHMNSKTTAGGVNNANLAGWVAPSVIGAISTTTQGIIVGTGTTAESFEGFALATPIATGTASGQLVYNAMSAPAPSYNAGTLTWTVTQTRIFNNNSGGTIGVTEVGLYADFNAGAFKAMIARDLLGATVNVANGGQCTVTYTFTLTFPA